MTNNLQRIEEERGALMDLQRSLPEKKCRKLKIFRVLHEVVEGSSSKDVLVRSYQRSFNGFAVKLTDQEQKRISRMESCQCFQVKPSNSSPPGHGISWRCLEGWSSPKKWKGGDCKGGNSFTCNKFCL
ncbi:hypothetical protein Q3G72_015481 [Acer saccharum]|nr:hypothetical protein Q3G72_015481 [Acer saccharum]